MKIIFCPAVPGLNHFDYARKFTLSIKYHAAQDYLSGSNVTDTGTALLVQNEAVPDMVMEA